MNAHTPAPQLGINPAGWVPTLFTPAKPTSLYGATIYHFTIAALAGERALASHRTPKHPAHLEGLLRVKPIFILPSQAEI